MYRTRPLRIAALAVRILLGLFFIISAVAKIIDIDQFEIYIFSFNLLPLNLSFLLARLIIVAEIWIGLGLLSNLFHRLVNTCTLLMLIGFTLFLAYAALIHRTDSCHCMGSLLPFAPAQSILKNALLLLLALFATGAKPFQWHPRWYIWLPLLLAPLATVFIISAPDNWLFGPTDELYNAEELNTALQPDGCLQPLHLDQGRHVVAFLTPGCQFCQMTDQKLNHICLRNQLDSTAFLYLCPTSDSTIAPLTLDTATFTRPTHLIPNLTWALITYGQRPIVFLMHNGQVTATCHYRNIDEQHITQFLTAQP